MAAGHSPRLIVVSGPSGVGKSTLVRELLERCPIPLVLSVSATTRAPRQGEREGVDYYFLTPEEFARRREAGEFLECCEVFSSGQWYGTLLSEVEAGLQAGKSVILEIDVQGAMKVMQERRDVVSIFIAPASVSVLEERLRGRGTEEEQVIERRLERSRREMESAHRYQHRVMNDEIGRAAQEMCEIITQAVR